MARRSDRFITPGVVMVMVLVAGVVLLAVVAAVTWLTALGKDPGPMIQMVVNVAGAAGGVLTFVVQLATRRTTTNVERKVGQLEANQAAQTVPPLEDDTTRWLPPVPDPTVPHPFMGTAPRPAGERRADQSARTRGTDRGRPEWPAAAMTGQVPPAAEATPRRHHRASTARGDE